MVSPVGGVNATIERRSRSIERDVPPPALKMTPTSTIGQSLQRVCQVSSPITPCCSTWRMLLAQSFVGSPQPCPRAVLRLDGQAARRAHHAGGAHGGLLPHPTLRRPRCVVGPLRLLRTRETPKGALCRAPVLGGGRACLSSRCAERVVALPCRAACCGTTGAACPARASRADTSRPSSTRSTRTTSSSLGGCPDGRMARHDCRHVTPGGCVTAPAAKLVSPLAVRKGSPAGHWYASRCT